MPCRASSSSSSSPERRFQQLVEGQRLRGQRRRELDQRGVGREPARERVAQPRLVPEDGGQRRSAHHLEGGEDVAEAALEMRRAGAARWRRPAAPTSAVARCAGRGTTRSTARVTTPKTPGRPHEELLGVEAGVVLAQRRHQVEDAAVGEHDLDPQQVLAHVAVAQDPRPAGVGDHHAADRGIGAEVDREHEPVLFERLVELAQQHAAPRHHRAVDGIDLERAGQPLEAQHQHLAGRVGGGRPHQAGVRALGHDADGLRGGKGEDARDLFRARPAGPPPARCRSPYRQPFS